MHLTVDLVTDILVVEGEVEEEEEEEVKVNEVVRVSEVEDVTTEDNVGPQMEKREVIKN